MLVSAAETAYDGPMKAHYRHRLVLTCAAVLFAACGDSGGGGKPDCEPGTALCACLDDMTCNDGLVCSLGSCASPDDVGTGTSLAPTTAGDPDASTSNSGPGETATATSTSTSSSTSISTSGGPDVSTSSSGPGDTDVSTSSSGSGDTDVSTSSSASGTTDVSSSGSGDPDGCPGECAPNAVEQKDCPWGEPAIRTCSESCTWGEFSACQLPGKGWRTMALSTTANIPARMDHTAVWTGDAMLVFGGQGGDLAPGAYDPVTNIWTKLALAPVAGHAVWTGSELVVIPKNNDVDKLGANFDPKTNKWTTHKSLFPLEKRVNFAFGVWMPTTQEVLVWGGYRKNCPCNLANGAALDVKSGTWRVVAASPLEPRDGYRPPGVVWNGSRVIVYGGGNYSGGRFEDAATYDPVTDTWATLPQSPQSGFTHLAANAIGVSGELAAFWGGDLFDGVNFNYPAKDGAIWDDMAKSWTAIPAIPSGGPFDAHNKGATWSVGKTFGLWGGRTLKNGFQLDDTGHIYDAATKTWTALPPGGPSGRTGVVAVWTGSEVIIWGGEAGNDGLQASGKIYRP